jgi:hypothetical protein
MLWRLFGMKLFGLALGLCVLFSTAWQTDSAASDYYHECGLPGGAYRMLDGVLFSGSGTDEKELKYKEISKVTLSEITGFCVGKTGNKYGFNSERYMQRVEIGLDDGSHQKLDFYCELVSDGLPAGDDCAREVKTRIKHLVPAYDTKITIDPDAPKQE